MTYDRMVTIKRGIYCCSDLMVIRNIVGPLLTKQSFNFYKVLICIHFLSEVFAVKNHSIAQMQGYRNGLQI